MVQISSTHTKVGGSSAGKTAQKKMDGYAANRVPESMLGSKPGLIQGSATRNVPYTGPNVARRSRGS